MRLNGSRPSVWLAFYTARETILAGQSKPTSQMQSLRQLRTSAVCKHRVCARHGFRQCLFYSVVVLVTFVSITGLGAGRLWAAGGTLTLNLVDETTDEPVISRVECFRVQPGKRDKPMPIRQTVDAGMGVVVDRSVLMELPDGAYRLQIIRGPEYRVVGASFSLEKTSLDEKTVALPRMIEMKREGWMSGDCCVVPSSNSLPLRMASEDLHVVAVLEDVPAKPIPHRDSDEPIEHTPTWIRSDVVSAEGLIFYGVDDAFRSEIAAAKSSTEMLVAASRSELAGQLKVGVENPFAWELPVWLASQKLDGLFVMGDWLRLDKTIYQVRDGRGEQAFSLREPTQVGRYAERIYRHLLDAGIDIVPLAGGGDDSAGTPVGYNRLYVTSHHGATNETGVSRPVLPTSSRQWWEGVWQGRSVATNGPLLRPLVAGKLPGHVFEGRTGEVLQLHPELNLTVRDPVDYLEVIYNNQVHYSARLDEFAEAGGRIPPIEAKQSGWVIMRVLTLHEGHYRAAMTAPWWIEFDGERRVSQASVEFFRAWLSAYEKRLAQTQPEAIDREAPFVRAARRFWTRRAEQSKR